MRTDRAVRFPHLWMIGSAALVVACCVACAESPQQPPRGPFGLTLVSTPEAEPADLEFFFSNETCGVCHERQREELEGSLHSVAHTDPLYRRFAELARDEAGPAVYTFCAGCHSSSGVVAGLIPSTPDAELPAAAKAGVTCATCHSITGLTGTKGHWQEEANASFVLNPGLVTYGATGDVADNRLHTGEKRAFFAKSEFCASCHTVIHPLNGIHIENTYGEWKKSVYAEKGIQCQDCHMRSVEDAVKVAETLEPVVVKGTFAVDARERSVQPHYFVGGNANADRLGGDKTHAQMAEARLKSAARLELIAPERAAPGKEFSLEVVVHNVAAGHHIPTGITELRQMWVQLEVRDERDKTIYQSGRLDRAGEIPEGAIWFGAVAGDAEGRKTYRPWEMTQFLEKRTIAPKGATRDRVTVKVPAAADGSLTVEAKLLYRSAPPGIVAEVLKEEAFTPTIVEMSTARAKIALPTP